MNSFSSFDDIEFHAHPSGGFNSIAKAVAGGLELSIIDGWYAYASKSTYEVQVTGVGNDGDDGVMLEYMTESDITRLMTGLSMAKDVAAARAFLCDFGPECADEKTLAEIEKTQKRKEADVNKMMKSFMQEQVEVARKKMKANAIADALNQLNPT